LFVSRQQDCQDRQNEYIPQILSMLDPTKLEHFRNLVSLSAADGKIEDVERVALSKIAYNHGIPLDRLTVMLKKASEYVYLIPQNNEDRERQLQEMIGLAWVDGEFAPAEHDLIRMVASKLGFSDEASEKIIADYKVDE
jgi:uncharacterized tellurite resistance protein B-like protein